MPSSRFSMGQALDWAWDTFKKNAVLLIGVSLVMIVFGYAPNLADWLLRRTHTYDLQKHFLLYNAITIIWLIPWSILYLGMIRITLKMIDGQQPCFADLFGSANLLWRYIAAQFLVALIVAGGLVLFIIPGIIWAIQYSMVPYLIVDTKMGAIDTLKRSSALTYGERWNLFVFGLVLLLIYIAGVVALFVGILVAHPILILAQVHVYRQLAYRLGQDQAQTQPPPDEEPGVGTGTPIYMPRKEFGDGL